MTGVPLCRRGRGGGWYAAGCGTASTAADRAPVPWVGPTLKLSILKQPVVNSAPMLTLAQRCMTWWSVR